ncbi:MAG: CopG family transcriptional regulator [Bacteroidetes bacterium]|nr:MAG: CopG family transcriptional regulator [Bacteroidota bacterium]
MNQAEKRIGAVIILIGPEADPGRINRVISDHAGVVLGRQGIPLRDRDTNVISLVLEGDTDNIGSLTGKLGRMPGVKVKAILV